MKKCCANELILCVDDDERAVGCGCGGRKVTDQLAEGFCFDHFRLPSRMISVSF